MLQVNIEAFQNDAVGNWLEAILEGMRARQDRDNAVDLQRLS
jgi:hypothetical protein